MSQNILFKKVKDDTISRESFIEHATKSYHVGTFLLDTLHLDVDKKKFLYSCFFHDVGKLIISPGQGPHTPHTRNGLQTIASIPEYPQILDRFHLDDFSRDEDVLKIIAHHHDAHTRTEAFVSIADQIASSESNDDLKNRFKEKAISTLITYVNEMHDLHAYNFFHLSIASFSKNEINPVGKVLLLKILFETIDSIPDIQLLYETLDGCRIVTQLSEEACRKKISEQFNRNIIEFISRQDISQLLGGAPDGYSQYTTLPQEIKKKIMDLTVEKYKNDMLRDLKKKNIEQLEDVGLNDSILFNFATLPDLKEYYSNIWKTKYMLLQNRSGTYNKEIVSQFHLKIKGDPIVEERDVVLEHLLEKAGADYSTITNKEIVYAKLCPLVVAINSINSGDTDFSFDIRKYLAIDGVAPLETIARENTCANCGTYEGTIPLGTFTFGHRQHFRESLFTETNDSIRKGKILVCDICHMEAVLNSLLCGITVQNQRSRINRKTHLIMYGLDIDKASLQQLTDKKLVERLLKDFRITGENVYVSKNQDMHIVFFSLEESSIGISNQLVKELLFSLIVTRLKIQNPLLYAFGVNTLPDILDNTLIQYKEGNASCIENASLDFFYYVLVHVTTTFEKKRDYIIKYHRKPFIGIAQIFKRENTRYTENTHEVVMKLESGDFKYSIMDQIWEMAKWGGFLETGKNVGSFLGVFKATPEDIDRIVNKFMKNEKLSKESRSKILKIHETLREEMKTLDDDQRREVKDYAQKTKYLFNSKKFHEVNTGGEEK